MSSLASDAKVRARRANLRRSFDQTSCIEYGVHCTPYRSYSYSVQDGALDRSSNDTILV